MSQAEVWVLDISHPGGADAWVAQEQSWLAGGVLHADEWAAAHAFRDAGRRHQHLAGRALARTRLARLCAVSPMRIGFVAASSGKPHAVLDGAPLPAHFNLSHSGERVVFALADSEVGVDIERCAPRLDATAIASRFFQQAEAHWIEAGGARSRQRFGALWTLKEACLKAQGDGLSAGLDNFTLVRTGFRRLHTDSVRGGFAHAAWHCHLRALPGYWLALCTALPCSRPHWFRISSNDMQLTQAGGRRTA